MTTTFITSFDFSPSTINHQPSTPSPQERSLPWQASLRPSHVGGDLQSHVGGDLQSPTPPHLSLLKTPFVDRGLLKSSVDFFCIPLLWGVIPSPPSPSSLPVSRNSPPLEESERVPFVPNDTFVQAKQRACLMRLTS